MMVKIICVKHKHFFIIGKNTQNTSFWNKAVFMIFVYEAKLQFNRIKDF